MVYNKAIDIMQENYIKSSSSNLNYTRELVDKEFSYIDKYISDLSTKPELRRIINLENPPQGSSDMYWFYEFYEFYNSMNLGDVKNGNKVFLLIDKNKTVFSKHYASFSFKDFYDNYFFYEDLDYDQWHSLYFGKRYYCDYVAEKAITINNTEEDYITLLYTIPIIQDQERVPNRKPVIAYLLNADNLKKMLQTTVSGTGSWAYIVNENNQIITSTSSDTGIIPNINNGSGYTFTSIDNEEVLAVYTELFNVPWYFVSITPLSSMKASLNQFRYISMGVLSVAMLIGLIIAVFMSYRNTKPIGKLMDMMQNFILEKDDSTRNEINRIQNGIGEIINDNTQMRKSITAQYDYLRILFFEKLMEGEFQNSKELDMAREHLDIDIRGNYFITILIRINYMDQLVNEEIVKEQDVYRAVLNKALTNTFGKKGYIHILNQNELVLLLSFHDNKEYRNELKDVIDEVSNSFASNFAAKPIFGIGSLHDSLLDVHLSLKEARYAADCMLYSNMKNTIIWYQDLKHNRYPQYYYTNEIEQRIVHLTKSGNYRGLKLTFSNMYINTIANKDMPDPMKRVFLNDLCATMIKLSEDLEIEVESKLLEGAAYLKAPEQYFESLWDGYSRICNFFLNRKKSHNQRLKEDMINYLNENFTDSSLCVASISRRFNLSEGYFSQFFKDQTGETFSRYLESLRMEYASSMLSRTNSSIKEIALQSGYCNATTFRRAFKRVKRMTPTEYIEANAGHQAVNDTMKYKDNNEKISE